MSDQTVPDQLDYIQTQLADLIASASEHREKHAPRINEEITHLREELLEQGVRLESLSQQLCNDFRTALEDLRQSQEAAANAQKEVLRSLTASLMQSMSHDRSDDLRAQIAELESRLNKTVREAVTAAIGSTPASPTGTLAGDRAEAQEEAPAPKTAEDSSKSWEQIRAAFMDPANVPGIDHSLQSTTSASSGIESKQSATATVGDDTRSPATPPPNLKDTQQFLLPTFALDCEVPELGDIESMSADQLRVALAERDCLVSTLIGRVRHLNDAHERSLSPEELGALGDEMPEELQQRVTETLNRMNEQLRLSELEMSLERARLSREKVQVEQSQQSLDRQARQMGLERREDGTFVVDRSNPGQKQPRRWLGRLGIGE
jgi:hypothetical protein